ncbi:Protein BAM-2 [Aphelenchoides avenae]|nr:Protein BAM-2 [Aphelenchus avenae]
MPSSGESHLPVVTVVHNAAEKWHQIMDGDKRTVGYQITDWDLLRQLVTESEKCSQVVELQWPKSSDISIQWPNPSSSVKRPSPLEVTLVSVSGHQKTVRQNATSPTGDSITLEGVFAGVLHVLSGSGEEEKSTAKNKTNKTSALVPSSAISIRLQELRCQSMIVPRRECHFELNNDTDRIRLNTDDHTRTLSFAFRTDRPVTRLLALVTAEASADARIQVDVADGYLIAVNHIIHPVKLLADGNWHSITVDLHTRTLFVDDMDTAISLSAKTKQSPLTAVDILLHGEVSGIRLDRSEWHCRDSAKLDVKASRLSHRQICGTNPTNYCKCKGPNSALPQRQAVASCSEPNEKNGYHLTRSPDKLAFFRVKDFGYASSASVVFKSDSNTGLVFFGASKGTASSADAIVRLQVHYVGEEMHAISCTLEANDSEHCKGCSIARNGGFANGQWVRVSVFHYASYQFLTVDGQICQFVPNAAVVDPLTEVYKVIQLTDSSLFVGGTYAASSLPHHLTKESFRRQFMDYTREKSPSLRGCIAEITVDRWSRDLEATFAEQMKDVSSETSSRVFSMSPGCPDCRNDKLSCNGAPCRDATPDMEAEPVCDCSSIFATAYHNNTRCSSVAQPTRSIVLSSKLPNVNITAPYRVPGNTVALELDKIWMLVRLPNYEGDTDQTLFKLGPSITVKLGPRAKKLIVELSTTKEEFTVADGDERLHLIAIQRNPVAGTSLYKKSVTIRFDGDVRTVTVHRAPEIPLHEGHSIVVMAVPAGKGGTHTGCIAEFSMSYEYSVGLGPPDANNRLQQVNWMDELVRSSVGRSAELIATNHVCGIRDPSLWTSNSSAFGYVGEYNPDGSTAARSSLTSIAITALLVAVVLISICVYCWCRTKRHSRSYRTDVHAGNEEKKLLHSDPAFSDTSSTTRLKSPNDSEGSACNLYPMLEHALLDFAHGGLSPAKPNANGNDTFRYAPERQSWADSPPVRAKVARVSEENPVVIQSYEASPKPIIKKHQPAATRRVPPPRATSASGRSPAPLARHEDV